MTMHVSIHAPAWGATRFRQVIDHRSKFQSTLPHGERRQSVTVRWSKLESVSIHAPAWGATLHVASGVEHDPVCFNPRSRMGSDTWLLYDCRPSLHVVSIHAPAWGATRLTIRSKSVTCIMFQSTLPHGERLYYLYLVDNTTYSSRLSRNAPFCLVKYSIRE